MRSIKLLLNKGIFMQNVRFSGWIAVFYFLMLFFAVPLQIIMIATRDWDDNYPKYFFESTESLFSILPELQTMIIFVIPVLLAIFLFRFMQTKLQADFMFSLPIKRRVLFHQQLLFGVISLIVPVVINAFILYVIRLAFPIIEKAPLFQHVWVWASTVFLFTLLLFFMTVMIGMFTGISVLQAIFSYIFIFLPLSLATLLFVNISYFLEGFSYEHVIDANVNKLFLIIRVERLQYFPLTTEECFGYLALMAVFYVISYIAFEKRPVEGATQAITYKIFRPVFWFGTAFCATLLGGMYFAEMQGRTSYGWLIFGYVIGAIFGYYIAMMILEKSWRVFHRYQGFAVFSAVMLLLAGIVHFDVFGYEKRIPAVEDVKKVYFGDRRYFYINEWQKENLVYAELFYQERESIEHIIGIHEAIIHERKKPSDAQHAITLVIVYELQNGKKLVREYKDIYLPDYEEHYRPLATSEEFKNNHNVLSKIDKSKINEFVFYNSLNDDKMFRFTNEEDVKELYDLLIAEFQEQTYEQLIDNNAWANIEVNIDGVYLVQEQILYKKSYDKLTKWLQEKGRLESIITVSDDLLEMKVMKLPGEFYLHEVYEMEPDVFPNDFIEITDKKQMDELLRLGTRQGRGEYALIITFPTYETSILLLKKDELPSYISL